MRRAHFLRNEAGEHIHLVRSGNGNEKIGMVNAGFRQRVAVCAVAANAHRVKNIRDLRDHVRVRINGGYVVSLRQKARKDRLSDLAASHDDNVHAISPYSSPARNRSIISPVRLSVLWLVGSASRKNHAASESSLSCRRISRLPTASQKNPISRLSV